jgi:hypothetical protein
MHLLGVQTPVTHQFPGEQQHGYFVAVAHPCGGIGVDIEDVDRHRAGFGQRGKLAQHLLAKTATGARVQQKARRGPAHSFSGAEGRGRRKT